jgi:mono/diheme cytochrome c family protein
MSWPWVALTIMLSSVASLQAHAEAAPTPAQIDQGRIAYEDNCEVCHGRDLVSPNAATFDLRKFPKDDPARFRGAVLDGKGTAMPAFRGRIGDEEVDLPWGLCPRRILVLARGFFTL